MKKMVKRLRRCEGNKQKKSDSRKTGSRRGLFVTTAVLIGGLALLSGCKGQEPPVSKQGAETKQTNDTSIKAMRTKTLDVQEGASLAINHHLTELSVAEILTKKDRDCGWRVAKVDDQGIELRSPERTIWDDTPPSLLPKGYKKPEIITMRVNYGSETELRTVDGKSLLFTFKAEKGDKPGTAKLTVSDF